MGYCTEGEMTGLLEKRYSTDEWAFFAGVRNGTGFSKSRTTTADAIALNLWPSRGLEVHGFEIKCRRNDFLRELKNPAKADEIQKYCDRWWVVAGDDEDIVKPGELPPTWGLMKKRGKSIVIIEAAPKLQPIDLDKGFICAIARSAKQYEKGEDHVRSLNDEAYDRGLKAGKESNTYDLRRANEQLNELRQALNEFEEKSGIKIDRWGMGRIAEAVKVISENPNLDHLIKDIERKHRIAQQDILNYEKQIHELRSIK